MSSFPDVKSAVWHKSGMLDEEGLSQEWITVTTIIFTFIVKPLTSHGSKKKPLGFDQLSVSPELQRSNESCSTMVARFEIPT